MVSFVPHRRRGHENRSHSATSPADHAGYVVESTTFHKSPDDPELSIEDIYSALERVGKALEPSPNTDA